MSKIDLIIDALSISQNSVWSKLNEQALAAARELKAEEQEPDKPLRLSPVYEYGHIHEASQPEQDKLLVDLIQEQRAEIDRLRQALAQPEQEPVAWMLPDYGDVLSASEADGTGIYNIPLYTAPPKREWVGLTEDDVAEVERWVEFKEAGSGQIVIGKLVRYIELKLRSKNNAV